MHIIQHVSFIQSPTVSFDFEILFKHYYLVIQYWCRSRCVNGHPGGTLKLYARNTGHPVKYGTVGSLVGSYARSGDVICCILTTDSMTHESFYENQFASTISSRTYYGHRVHKLAEIVVFVWTVNTSRVEVDTSALSRRRIHTAVF